VSSALGIDSKPTVPSSVVDTACLGGSSFPLQRFQTPLWNCRIVSAAVFQTAVDLGALVIAFVTLQSVYSYSDCAARISTVLFNVQGFPHGVM